MRRPLASVKEGVIKDMYADKGNKMLSGPLRNLGKAEPPGPGPRNEQQQPVPDSQGADLDSRSWQEFPV